MKRRQTLKTLLVGSVSAGVLLDACKQPNPETTEGQGAKVDPAGNTLDRMEEERILDDKVKAEKFFTAEEMATITALCAIIIPADEWSGSAVDAGVPEFISLIVNDMPEHQTPLRGGLQWLNLQCMNQYGKSFVQCNPAHQLAMVDEIAWPEKAKPGMEPGVRFFNRLRDLTATGFFTSEIGIQDLGYMGNKPNAWKGVPDEVLKQYGLSYSEKQLKECV